jgi:chromosome segregation ATPase
MRSISSRQVGRYAAALLAAALVVPFLNGCSTLGIATTDELTAMESSQRTSNNSTNTRIDNLEKSTGDLQTTLTQMTASIDTLNARFARAKTWLETMNVDTISADAQKASEAAMSAEARSREFLEHYLEWIKAQHAALEQQITTLEAKMKQAPSGDSKKPDADKPVKEPADSGGGGSSGEQD